MYETASKRVYKSKRCVLFMTFRPSQRTLFMARRNWVLLALSYSGTSSYKSNPRSDPYLSLVVIKPVFGVSDKVRHKHTRWLEA